MVSARFSTLVVIGSILVGGCSGNSATGPSPAAGPAPAAATFTLTGQTRSTTPGLVIAGATVTIADGPSVGRSVRTDATGAYTFAGLPPAGFTVNAAAAGYAGTATSVTLTSNQTRDLTLTPAPLFAVAGVGNTVFDMPTYVSRVRIQGRWNGTSTSNFVVLIGGRLVVNEILRQTITYDGTHAVVGGPTQITDSAAITWTITELAGVR